MQLLHSIKYDSGADDGCVDGDDVNLGATNSSVADPRVDSAGGL